MSNKFARFGVCGLLGTAAVAAAFAASPALAQSTDSPAPAPAPAPAAAATDAVSNDQTDIIVTATKRGAESIQNVPISIQALTGRDLALRGASDFNDFARLIPGLSAQDTGPGDKRYIIRGITTSGPGTVGVYLDEAIITGENIQDGGGQQTDIKLFDIQRVEVLKGPQGTTFGSSSLGGTIRYITNKPDLDNSGGTTTVKVRSTKGADLGIETEGAINLAVLPGRLGVRVAGYYGYLPGYIDTMFEKGADRENTKAIRGSALLKITDGLTLSVMAMYQRTHQDAKNFYNLQDYFHAPVAPYSQAQIVRAPYDDKNQIYNATLDYKVPFGTFTATASRYVRDLNYVRDASPFADALLHLPYYTTGRTAITQPKHRKLDNYEARFASDFGGPLNVLVGVFGSDENRYFRSQWVSANSAGYVEPSLGPLLLDRVVDSTIRERAVFGEAYLKILDSLKLTVGGRYYNFKLDQVTSVLIKTGGAPGSGVGLLAESKVDGFIPRFNLAFSPTKAVNAYVQVAKGFRAGGNNDQTAAAIVNVAIPAGYKPDSLWNYEIGVKTTLFGGALLANVSAYYVDWKDVQIKLLASRPGLSAGYPYTGNGGKAEVKGVEASLTARPVRGLVLAGTLNYNDATLAQTNVAPATGNKGDPLPYTPKWSLSGSVDYDFPLDALGVTGTIGGDVSYTDDRVTDFNPTLIDYRVLPANTLISLRAGVRAKGWSVSVVANNVFNDQHVINYTSLGFGSAPDELYVNRPRTVMLSVTTSF